MTRKMSKISNSNFRLHSKTLNCLTILLDFEIEGKDSQKQMGDFVITKARSMNLKYEEK